MHRILPIVRKMPPIFRTEPDNPVIFRLLPGKQKPERKSRLTLRRLNFKLGCSNMAVHRTPMVQESTGQTIRQAGSGTLRRYPVPGTRL